MQTTIKRNFSMLLQTSGLNSKMIMIDCSSKDSYRRAHIPDAIHLPVNPLKDLPPNHYPAKLMPGQFLKDSVAPS